MGRGSSEDLVKVGAGTDDLFTRALGSRRGSGRCPEVGDQLLDLLTALRKVPKKTKNGRGEGLKESQADESAWKRACELADGSERRGQLNSARIAAMRALDGNSIPARIAAMYAATAICLRDLLTPDNFEALAASGRLLVGDHPALAAREAAGGHRRLRPYPSSMLASPDVATESSEERFRAIFGTGRTPSSRRMELPQKDETPIYCEECGKPVVPDPTGSEGVWVHDAEVLGDEAYDLNEEHGARPPEEHAS